MKKYCIEQLTTSGFWSPLRQSIFETGFIMLPYPQLDSVESAQGRVEELIQAGWGSNYLRVAEVSDRDLI